MIQKVADTFQSLNCPTDQINAVCKLPEWRTTADNAILRPSCSFDGVTTEERMVLNASLPEVLGPVPRRKEELHRVLVITLNRPTHHYRQLNRLHSVKYNLHSSHMPVAAQTTTENSNRA